MKNLFFGLLLFVLFCQVDGQNVLKGPTTTNIAVARAISPNGNYVVGQALTDPREAFAWNVYAGNVITNMGGVIGNDLSEAYDVSNTYRVVGDFADPNVVYEGIPIRSAGYWENGTWTGLGLGLAAGSPPASYIGGSHAASISADGNIIAGFCITFSGDSRVHPYSWTYNEATSSWDGQVWAAPVNNPQGSAIVSMSANGNIAAGWANLGTGRTGIFWTSKDEYQLLDLGNVNYDVSEYICVSRNGKYAGFRYNGIAGFYDVENNEHILIPEGLIISAISDNGFAVGTYYNDLEAAKGFIWSKTLGFMDFNEFRLMFAPDIFLNPSMQSALDPTTHTSYALHAISADGQSMLMRVANRGLVMKLASPIVVVPFPKNFSGSVSREDRNIVNLTWEAPEPWTEELLSYVIYRDNVQIATVAAGSLNYTDMAVPAGYKKYSIQAVYQNCVSKKSQVFTVPVVNNYNIPFTENFASGNFTENYWTTVDKKYSCAWMVDIQEVGSEDVSGTAVLHVVHNQTEPFSAMLISKPFDCSNTEHVYLSYILSPYYYVDNNLTKDSIFVDVTTDGITWTNVYQYVFKEISGWRAELLDISDIAAGELVNIRFRIEGINYSINAKFYSFTNISVTPTMPHNGVPMQVRGKENLLGLDLAWQNPDGLFALTYQQTPCAYGFGNEGANMIAAQSFDKKDLDIYNGLSVVSISAYIYQVVSSPVPTKLKLAVFVDDQRIVNQDVDKFTPNAWNTFTLTTPLLLNTVQNNLKIGIELGSHDIEEIPIGADDGISVAGKGDLYSTNGGATWEKLADLPNGNLRRNWCIVGNLALEENSAERTDDIMGYNLYFDGEQINDVLIFGQTFTTENKKGCYTVRAYSLTNGISALSEPYCLQIGPYITPNTALAYSFDDLVTHSSGTVVKENGIYYMRDDVTISPLDSLVVTEDITVKIFTGKTLTINASYWEIGAPKQALFTNYTNGEYYETIHIEEGSYVRLNHAVFTYGSGMRVIESDFEMDSCTMNNNNFSSQASGAISSTAGKVIVKNSTFKNNVRSAFNSGANIGSTFEIINCYLENNVTENSNRPQINVGPSQAGETTKIIGNTIIGNRNSTLVGGIGASSLMSVPAAFLIEGNTVKDNRYGITLTGTNITGTIKGNTLEDNNTQNEPALGGSGINITAPAGNTHAVISENIISGNLWGITLVGNTATYEAGPTANVGNISVPENDPEYNIGKNIFSNNGNNGELFDLYNNNPNDVMAQHNNWGVPQQTEELIRTVIRDKFNDERYGIVNFMPPYIIDNPVTDIQPTTLSIYPNPVNDNLLKITRTTNGNAQIEIYNSVGALVQTHSAGANESAIQINVSSLSSGIYLLRLIEGQNSMTQRFVKQ